MDIVKSRLKAFEEKTPEIVFEWYDNPTGARGWLVINNVSNGSAGGGTRMRQGLNRHEVVSLAKTMELKFAVSGPPIGGAKSGIDFDPRDPRKAEVLARWFKAVMPLLKTYYGTGGDLNVDELIDVMPITSTMGLLHPQEGTVVGHLNPSPENKAKILDQLVKGTKWPLQGVDYNPIPGGTLTVADMITGWGTAEAVRHFYEIWEGKENISDKRAIVQGFGNVAAAAAFYLAKMGVKVVGIIDRVGGLISTEGMDAQAIQHLLINRKNNSLEGAEGLIDYNALMEQVWDVPHEIFVPAAASRLVTKEHVNRLKASGCEVISCGANVPFADEEIFLGPIANIADAQMAVIPDFIANCAMARTFAYLMQDDCVLSDEAIFADTSKIIHDAMERLHASRPEPTLLMAYGLDMILDVIESR